MCWAAARPPPQGGLEAIGGTAGAGNALLGRSSRYKLNALMLAGMDAGTVCTWIRQ